MRVKGDLRSYVLYHMYVLYYHMCDMNFLHIMYIIYYTCSYGLDLFFKFKFLNLGRINSSCTTFDRNQFTTVLLQTSFRTSHHRLLDITDSSFTICYCKRSFLLKSNSEDLFAQQWIILRASRQEPAENLQYNL